MGDVTVDLPPSQERVVRASRVVKAAPETIFELIADPNQQPTWDGNDNLRAAHDSGRIRGAGETFLMELTHDGSMRENHVVEFEEGRLIAWMPGDLDAPRAGHLWRWELDPAADGTLVTHTYDWRGLDEAQRRRIKRALRTTPKMLQASVDRLAERAEADSDEADPVRPLA